ncbi:DUF6527 family protein [Antarcticirhabdus aurantiaca]|uniref:DUF6527 family protein n=1 Tax=Antarcticirhabdus aurantiaca TaxID=2606717 RepID=UPI00131C0168|nr:DUF6527 family protein [Antarcticirhabdus aurantiaca]
MAARGVLRTTDDGRLFFHCPGCSALHGVGAGEGAGPRWMWNGSFDKPTFTPSVMVEGVQPLTDEEHARVMAGETIEPRPLVCHSFVMVGRMHFLDDCTHALAGEIVDLPRLDIGQDG